MKKQKKYIEARKEKIKINGKERNQKKKEIKRNNEIKDR
jgi:hypothetical protein